MKFDDVKNLAFRRVIETEAYFIVDAYKASKTYGDWATENEKNLKAKYCEYYANKYSERELADKLTHDKYTVFSQKDRAKNVQFKAREIDNQSFDFSHKVVLESQKENSK